MNRIAVPSRALPALPALPAPFAAGAAHAHPGHAEAGLLAMLLASPHELLHLLEGETGMLLRATIRRQRAGARHRSFG